MIMGNSSTQCTRLHRFLRSPCSRCLSFSLPDDVEKLRTFYVFLSKTCLMANMRRHAQHAKHTHRFLQILHVACRSIRCHCSSVGRRPNHLLLGLMHLARCCISQDPKHPVAKRALGECSCWSHLVRNRASRVYDSK